ncbi:hypothetical protein BST97_09680 [Nonlabens spongiae]|uniref:Uncharacterized protein n=1 Tax=Nonlabens spongiae TaxID=331648 RepID=A0A1W6MLA1_9FLAO|nr:hypothetical protein [Nonlabens spongiae]ARN78239.1 hypothetical protein BST97_09680 [Nonlabens spongiae]
MTDSQRNIVGEILLQMNNIHNARDRAELETIGRIIYNQAFDVEPRTVESINGEMIKDQRGKDLLLGILDKDINSLGTDSFPTLKDEKLAMLTSLRLLINAFVLLPMEDLRIIKKTLG